MNFNIYKYKDGWSLSIPQEDTYINLCNCVSLKNMLKTLNKFLKTVEKNE